MLQARKGQTVAATCQACAIMAPEFDLFAMLGQQYGADWHVDAPARDRGDRAYCACHCIHCGFEREIEAKKLWQGRAPPCKCHRARRDARARETAPGRILSLPRLLTDEDVAAALGCSTQTVKRERRRGRLGYTRVGGRIRYTEAQITAYLQDRRKEPSCESEKTGSARSATIGLAGDQTAPRGAAPGSIQEHDRHNAHRLAQIILMKPSSRSPRG